MYLFDVTRDTVLSCIEMASAMVFRLSGRKCWDAMHEKRILLAHDLLGDAQNGARPLVEAFNQPVCRLQAFQNVVLVFLWSRLTSKCA